MDELRTTISPVVIDLIFAAIILLVASLKAKAGLYQTIMSVVVVVLAIAIGFVASNMALEPVSEYAWEKYGPTVEEKFDEEVAAATSGERSLSQVFRDSWNRVINSFDIEKLDALKLDTNEGVDYTNSEIVLKLKAVTLAKARLVCDTVCHVGLFGIITAISLLVLTIIKNIIGKVADFSVVGWVNHLGGFALGAVEAIVILLLIVRGATLIGIPFFVNNAEGTVLLKWLIGGDIQATIQSLQNITIEDIKNIKLENLTTVDFKEVGKEVMDLVKNIDLSDSPLLNLIKR